jgi:hypothetical protein
LREQCNVGIALPSGNQRGCDRDWRANASSPTQNSGKIEIAPDAESFSVHDRDGGRERGSGGPMKAGSARLS